ncbi:MAG: carbamoyl transferase, partial [Candidatus Thermoplasmatota archaeon]|nr:carbamoyl transferase [Candidatus Thermoplasmatota archaeon]
RCALPIWRLKEELKGISDDLSDKIITVEHHKAHAAGAFFTSGWNKCVVLTIDAAGDGVSSKIYVGDDQELKPVAESSYLDSLGDLYASITEMLGFIPMRHEGKIMALAGFSEEESHDLSECIEVKGLSFENHLEVTGSESVKKISEKVGFPLNRKEECSNVLRKGKKDHELWELSTNLANSAQSHLENMLSGLGNNMIRCVDEKEETGGKIAYAGGVAQNVKGNRILREKFSDCWIFPHMGDGGLALGAALYLNAKSGERKKKWDWKDDTESVYLGPKYSSRSIERTIEKEEEVTGEKVNDKEEVAADLLAEKKIVALFQGRIEYGPRALGNRSILADPSTESVRDRLNDKLGRDAFQPFSPTILERYKDTYLKDPEKNRFMTMSFETTERAREDIPAALHVDGTCRPQILKKEDNETFYNIVDGFEKQTGIGAVLNTSFNLHGEPIVCSPDDAVSSFERMELDALLMGMRNKSSFILVKRTSPGT